MGAHIPSAIATVAQSEDGGSPPSLQSQIYCTIMWMNWPAYVRMYTQTHDPQNYSTHIHPFQTRACPAQCHPHMFAHDTLAPPLTTLRDCILKQSGRHLH